MPLTPLFRTTFCLLLIPGLAACSSLWPSKKEAEPAPMAPQQAPKDKPAPQAPAAAAASISAADLEGIWECQFQISMGKDSASFTYTNQFNADHTLRSQAFLAYDMSSTEQQYRFVLQGTGQWRMDGSTITMIVPKVVKQDRSEHKKPELMNDKDLVPEDLSDTWMVQAHKGKNLRVTVGSLADSMLCNKE